MKNFNMKKWDKPVITFISIEDLNVKITVSACSGYTSIGSTSFKPIFN